MSNSTSTPLFACSRCFSRHPFEELSTGEQLCKECRGSFPVVKCTYCRSEFQQTSKSNTSSICKKCEANVKAYGKPTACEYCNIIAAFIGNKCQRCTNSERKYGPAVTCEQCKQRCAFDRHDDSKKVDGKLLCWLCTQSLKRALARTKQHISSVDKHKHRSKSGHKDKRKSDMMKSMNSGDSSLNDSQPSEKKTKMNPMQGKKGELDPNSSDHVVAMTQLKETIASLNKRVQQKDNELLAKDKLITELKAQHMNNTQDLRNEMKNKDRLNETKFNLMNTKIQNLLKEVATLIEALTCKEIKAFVDGHNQRRYQLARGQVRGQPAASNMKFMMWDEELQAKAERWAAKNRHQHNPDKTIGSGRFRTGENLYWYGVTNRNYQLNPDQALESWFNEHKNFTFAPLSTSDFDGSKDYQIGHYTQMAWADTVFVGCAITDSAKGRWKKFFVVCNYGPAGNFLGQAPYKAGRNNPHLMCDCRKYGENCNCNEPYGRSCKNA